MAYIGKSPTGTGVRSRYYYTATGGETSLSGADDNSNTLVFSDGNYVDVSLNGIALVAGTDYNTSTANTISGLSALSASDIVEIVVYDIFTVADTVSAKDGGTFSGNVAMNGDLTVDTSTLKVDSTNNWVGIVNASPSTPLDVVGTGQFTNTSAGASATAIKLQNLDNNVGSATSLDFAPYGNGTVTDKIEGGHDGSNKFSLRFHTYSSGLAERMRIDGDGKVHVNQTSDWAASYLSAFATNAPAISARTNQTNGTCLIARHDGGGVAYNAQFYNNTSLVGSIQTTASATSYVTSSDYRLKTAVNYDWDATTRLKQLRPARFEWIADGDDAVPVDGFLAHEVQSVVPEAITGTHNEVDDDGNPVYQGIDQSKLVPLLVKTIQELEARITALENV